MGGICSDAGGEQLDSLSNYGLALGLAFQIKDDILDETSTPEMLGKATQKDIAAGKLTYPGVFGIEESRKEAVRMSENAIEALSPFGPEADNLRALARYIVERNK